MLWHGLSLLIAFCCTWKELKNSSKNRLTLWSTPSVCSAVIKANTTSWIPNRGMRVSVDFANLRAQKHKCMNYPKQYSLSKCLAWQEFLSLFCACVHVLCACQMIKSCSSDTFKMFLMFKGTAGKSRISKPLLWFPIHIHVLIRFQSTICLQLN